MEMAIAGDARGGKEMHETPEQLAEKQIMAEMLAAENRRKSAAQITDELNDVLTSQHAFAAHDGNGNKALRRLNALIDALASIDGMCFDCEEIRTKLGEALDELVTMRARMYGHLVDWGKVARDGHN